MVTVSNCVCVECLVIGKQKTRCVCHGVCVSVCFFVLCNRHWFDKAPGPDPRGTELEVTYLPSAFNSDASCADLPVPLLGAPVDIGLW